MSNETTRGRAQLRDLGPAQGLYEVDYVVHINIRTIKNLNAATTVLESKSANISTVSGLMLKNGLYDLEKDGATLYKLEKTGTDWRIISSNSGPSTVQTKGKPR